VEGNVAVDALAHRYSNCDPDAIVEYCDLILSQSDYPEFMPKEWQVEYLPTSSIIVMDYQIPSAQDMPTLKEVRYFLSKNCLEHIHLREGTINKVYNKVIYQVCLRTIHELFEADVAGALKSIVFNGWVHYKDKATGNDTRACIMSVEASKERFLQINLAAVDPKECFRSLKGVGSTQLHGMAPIAPVLQLNRSDSRFVASVDVASHLDEGTNLAAIGWEEFEHLIRQVFEQEFSASGGEVKVTQASRDGGVDAVAFDPDPIRGGKIVIQAKRYTNTVDVSAVRDLYGTVMNEGATKGILVTTSDFGPDAYRFIKDKPLTLLNGSNLLHLLSKHGHRARIDLKEAKLLGIGLRR
jgi:restriction system protein